MSRGRPAAGVGLGRGWGSWGGFVLQLPRRCQALAALGDFQALVTARVTFARLQLPWKLQSHRAADELLAKGQVPLAWLHA